MNTFFTICALIAEAPNGQSTLHSSETITALRVQNASLQQAVEMLTEERNYLRDQLKEGKANLRTLK